MAIKSAAATTPMNAPEIDRDGGASNSLMLLPFVGCGFSESASTGQIQTCAALFFSFEFNPEPRAGQDPQVSRSQ
jgi:hypothetical protein